MNTKLYFKKLSAVKPDFFKFAILTYVVGAVVDDVQLPVAVYPEY